MLVFTYNSTFIFLQSYLSYLHFLVWDHWFNPPFNFFSNFRLYCAVVLFLSHEISCTWRTAQSADDHKGLTTITEQCTNIGPSCFLLSLKKPPLTKQKMSSPHTCSLNLEGESFGKFDFVYELYFYVQSGLEYISYIFLPAIQSPNLPKGELIVLTLIVYFKT